MSPKFYGILWIVFGASAGAMWLGGVLTMVAVVVFGFIAFGLIFAGMMCVLPGEVSYPPVQEKKKPLEKKQVRRARAPNSSAHAGLATYRSV